MWLFEGSQKALLVDTAQNTADKPIAPVRSTSSPSLSTCSATTTPAR